MAGSQRRRCLCVSLALLALIAVVILCGSLLGRQSCSVGLFKRGAVAADSGTCSKIGRDILQQGGSAVDGAIAALLCTSIINPQSMGLGGGSIFTVREKSGRVRVIIARETTPVGARADLLKECPLKGKTDSQWIGIPGELRGYEWVHQRYGRLTWASLFQPTIRLARQGVPLSPIMNRFQEFHELEETSPLRKLFSHKNNTLLKVGDTVKFEKLADTLEIIAKEGASAFYTGPLAKDLVQDVRDAGGTLSMEDLKSYTVKDVDPWSIKVGDYTMYFPPPPSGGAFLSFILNIMKGFNLDSFSILGKQKTLTYHRYIEACKFANSRRSDIRDPAFVSDKNAFQMTTEELADRVRLMISSNRTYDLSYYNITPSGDQVGTTHLSVLDEEGTAVSVTSSINNVLGSKIYSPKTGVILNNQLRDFCGYADSISTGERPPSSMTPAIFLSETSSRMLLIGASGGSMILAGVAQTIMNHLWFGMNLKDAISTPIVYVDQKNTVKFEPKFDQNVSKALEALGHTVGNQSYFYNVVNAISKVGPCIEAVSDSRKLGEAAGY
ncbi:gamma-glutamyltransferase 5a [Paramormyrops kingsleyae]|uniref:gamma-glutamyltransferase 5a n=1 Tax=Paramormyrops kingsleyae TaxID=1676925 RepID=UPI003B9735A8